MKSKIDLSQFIGYSPGEWTVIERHNRSQPLASPFGLVIAVEDKHRICRFTNTYVATMANAKLMAKAPLILAYARDLEAEVTRLKALVNDE